MATRRTAAGQKAVAGDEKSQDRPSDTRPAVPQGVILKLLVFTFAMITLPIGSYFLSVNTIFNGNTTYAGATAAVLANVVLIGYVIVAYQEDQSDRAAEDERLKKGQ